MGSTRRTREPRRYVNLTSRLRAAQYGSTTQTGRSNFQWDIFWWVGKKHGRLRPVFAEMLAEWTNSGPHVVELADREERRFRRQLARGRRGFE